MVNQQGCHTDETECVRTKESPFDAKAMEHSVRCDIGHDLRTCLAQVVRIYAANEVFDLELDLEVAERTSDPLNVHDQPVDKHIIVLADVLPSLVGLRCDFIIHDDAAVSLCRLLGN